MTTDVTGFVKTDRKDFFLIVSLIEGSLSSLVNADRKQEIENGINPFKAFMKNKMGDTTVNVDSGMVSIQFIHNNKHRNMTVQFNCDGDHEQAKTIDGNVGKCKKIIISLGASGEADLYIRRALLALSILGETFYRNDLDNDDYWKQDNFKINNLVDLMAINFQKRNTTTLNTFLNMVSNAIDYIPVKTDFQNLGLTEEVIDVVKSYDCDEATYEEVKKILSQLAHDRFEEMKNENPKMVEFLNLRTNDQLLEFDATESHDLKL